VTDWSIARKMVEEAERGAVQQEKYASVDMVDLNAILFSHLFFIKNEKSIRISIFYLFVIIVRFP
jgi:hypothetical protein